MRRLAALVLLLTACGCGRDAPAPKAEGATGASTAPAAPAAPSPQAPTAAPRWDLPASGQGRVLVFLTAGGATVLRLFCPTGGKSLRVNVPAFRPIGSEERLSLGSGAAVAALVADSRGDRQRGGVSGVGAVPADLAKLVAGPVAASYGAQSSGPHPAPPPGLARAFVAACEGRAPPTPTTQPKAANPCHLQAAERLAAKPLRAIGTEPFWAATTEGRCVTYSHPDDQKGTRIWGRFQAGEGGGGTWSGALRGKGFVLRIHPQPGCSDGMSDRRYPLGAELLVEGELRRGCAAPL